jgi:2-methylisocitrate lyase-like PEP mutase family enzyme
MATDQRRRFADLHRGDVFVMPNPWDVGSARLLESMGFAALATTSSGHAATLGRSDQHVTRDELLAHTATLTAAVGVPLNVDAEHGFADDPAGVAETVALVADAGAAGCSVEDYDPARAAIDPVDVATERVGAAAEAAHRSGLVLTARAENHLYGAGTLDDTIGRLRAYRDAGAHVVYAPGLSALSDIEQVVRVVEAPVNVLALPAGPSVPELASVGVRRVSTGGALAWAAYGALVAAAGEVRDRGTSTYAERSLTAAERERAFGA